MSFRYHHDDSDKYALNLYLYPQLIHGNSCSEAFFSDTKDLGNVELR